MKKLISIAVVSAALAACGSDDDSNLPVEGEQVTFALTTDRTNVSPNYLITQGGLEDTNEILSSQGQGIEISDYSYFHTVDNTLFSLTSTSVKAYGNVDGQIEEINEAVYNGVTWATFGNDENDKMIAIDSNWSSLLDHELYTFNATTGLAEGSVSLQILSNNTNGAAWPTALVVSGDKLYIPYITISYEEVSEGVYAALTRDSDNGHVAVFDYPVTDGATPVTTISSDSISNLGTHGSKTGLIKTDSGDLYGYTNGEVSGGFYPASNHPSSIVKISSGASEFDSTYEFDIETETQGGKIYWFDYIGGDKALARIVERRDILVDHDENSETAEVQLDDVLDAVAWEDFYNSSEQAYRQKLVIIDLVSKTVTDVDGVPSHWSRLAPDTEIIDGKYYTTITTSEGTSVYLVDIETGNAVEGASVEGFTARGYQDLYN